jgi:hypothetical protein
MTFARVAGTCRLADGSSQQSVTFFLSPAVDMR